VDDPLPALLEPVQGDAIGSAASGQFGLPRFSFWHTDYSEMRDDRAVFFCNDYGAAGRFQLEYYARVTGEGEVYAPPAKAETMYDPERRGLSGSGRLKVSSVEVR
jgi:uncharacterized protein YfaS (alpha-2-macroglobulin family)